MSALRKVSGVIYLVLGLILLNEGFGNFIPLDFLGGILNWIILIGGGILTVQGAIYLFKRY